MRAALRFPGLLMSCSTLRASILETTLTHWQVTAYVCAHMRKKMMHTFETG